MCLRNKLIQLSKQLLTPHNLRSCINYLQVWTSYSQPKNKSFLEFLRHYCMFQKLANTAIKTTVDTSQTPIIFLFPTTLYFIPKSKKWVLPQVFKLLYVSEISWYSCQNSCQHLTNFDHFSISYNFVLHSHVKKHVLPRVLMHFCVLLKLADTAAITAVDTSQTVIIFLVPTTLYFIAK